MRTSTAPRDSLESASPAAAPHRSWLREHRPFLVALLLGVVIRIVVQIAFSPAFVHSDGPAYLAFLHTFEPLRARPAGYSLFVLFPLSWLTDKVFAVTVAQHLFGVATAGLMYALLRRWGVRRWPATLATLPVLFDALQLVLEQTVLSDTLFDLVVMLAVTVLGWRRRPSPALALAAGVLFGVSVTIRLVGEPLILSGVAFCLLVGKGWRGRLAGAIALTVGFAIPVGAYATWYHHQRGAYALSQFTGKALYLRTTSFVDCSALTVPDYERVLCPVEPRGQRRDPTFYGWHDLRTIPSLKPPPGTTQDQAMREFAVDAIRAQPVDYALYVLRDVVLYFDVRRTDRFEYDTAHKWLFRSYVHPDLTQRTRDSLDQHGGDLLTPRHPYAEALAGYQWVGYLPGPLLFGCLLLGLLGGLGIGKARHSGLRSMCLLLTVTGFGLLLVPAVTADFSWRYQLPALVLLPAGAALGFTALRGRQVDAGTVATAKTD